MPEWVAVFDGQAMDAEVAAAALRAAGIRAETSFNAGPGGGGLWLGPSSGFGTVLVPTRQRAKALRILDLKPQPSRVRAERPERRRRPRWMLPFVVALALVLAAAILIWLGSLEAVQPPSRVAPL